MIITDDITAAGLFQMIGKTVYWIRGDYIKEGSIREIRLDGKKYIYFVINVKTKAMPHADTLTPAQVCTERDEAIKTHCEYLESTNEEE